jgi:exodeoxyribonuclease V alpha subunit
MTRSREASPLALHPHGTLRARLEPRGNDDVFRRLGIGARRCDLGDEGLYLAEELVAADRWLGGSDPDVLGILVLALMIAERQGSTRLPLDARTLRPLVASIANAAGLDESFDIARAMKQIANLTRAPGFHSVIGSGDARRPLVVDNNCLYTERARAREVRVAARLCERASAAPLATATTAATAAPANTALSPEQLRAVDLARHSAVTVITGGPGTGKTRVAAAIVRALLADGVAVDRIALAAPTGRAANRLGEVIAADLGGAAANAPAAQTLHRLLGFRPDGGFAHHARSPLAVDAVIVDEASMIDLELADALLDAVPPTARLVLVGDAGQLPAVDAGRVLADLCADDAPTAIRDKIAALATSYRANVSEPRGRAIHDLARAIERGDAGPLVERSRARTPGTLAFDGVEWIEPGAAHDDVARTVVEQLWHHAGGPRLQDRANQHVFRFENGRIAAEQRATLVELLADANRARALAVTRALPTGALALNAHLHERALANTSLTLRPEFVPGEPVTITANDHARGLFNGDQGLIVRVDEGNGSHRYRAVFRVAGEPVPFAIEALRDRLELAWVLTVHKSQGSELDAIALVLPEDDLPLLTRELVYTAITRARHAVVVYGSRAMITTACKRVAVRESGLPGRLRATLPR